MTFTALCLLLATVLAANLLAGLVRIARGPSPADTMLAAQLFGTTGVGILLLLAEATGTASLRDIALTVALLAALATVAFVRRAWRAPGEER